MNHEAVSAYEAVEIERRELNPMDAKLPEESSRRALSLDFSGQFKKDYQIQPKSHLFRDHRTRQTLQQLPASPGTQAVAENQTSKKIASRPNQPYPSCADVAANLVTIPIVTDWSTERHKSKILGQGSRRAGNQCELLQSSDRPTPARQHRRANICTYYVPCKFAVLVREALQQLGWSSNPGAADVVIKSRDATHAFLENQALRGADESARRKVLVNHHCADRCYGVHEKRNLLHWLRKTHAPAELEQWFPVTFDLLIERERELFKERFAREAAATEGTSARQNLWLVKPSGNGWGRGIVVDNRLPELVRAAKDNDWNVVVQKYVDKPLALGGRKFDFRVWVLITRWTPMQGWLVEEPYGRICPHKLELGTNGFRDNHVHLTNVHPLGGDNRNGLSTLLSLLYKDGFPQGVWEERIWPNLVAMIRRMLDAIEVIPDKNAGCPGVQHIHSIECLGVDVLLDEELNPWLLEVNCNPSLCPNTTVPEVRGAVRRSLKGAIHLGHKIMQEGDAWLPGAAKVDASPCGIRVPGVDFWRLIKNKEFSP